MNFINWEKDGIRADELEDQWGCRFSDILELIKLNELPFFLKLGRIVVNDQETCDQIPEEFEEITAEIDQLSRDIPDEGPKGDGKTYISCGGSATMQDGSDFDLFIKYDYLLCALDRRNDRVIEGLNRSDVFFNKSDVKEIGNKQASGKKKISDHVLSQSKRAKEIIKATGELSLYCNEKIIPVSENDKLNWLYTNYKSFSKHLCETIARNLPNNLRRKRGESDKNIKPRKINSLKF